MINNLFPNKFTFNRSFLICIMNIGFNFFFILFVRYDFKRYLKYLEHSCACYI